MKNQDFLPFGSFFGPSDRYIAPRLLEESKALDLDNYLTAAKSINRQKSPLPTPPKTATDKNKILKKNRDYSFLLEDSKECSEQKDSVPEKPKKISEVVSKNKEQPRKLPPKDSVSEKPKKISEVAMQNRQQPRKLPAKKVALAPPTVMQKKTYSLHNDKLEKREVDPRKGRPAEKVEESKKVAAPSVMKKKTYSLPNNKLEKREVDPPEKRRKDNSMAFVMLRKFTGYNPSNSKYRGMDYDDRNMEVGFRDLQKEERRSAKIAREEDAEEEKLNAEIEKREKLSRKKAKRESYVVS